MRNIVLLSASALVLALGVASASAEPRTEDLINHGQRMTTTAFEGRAASVDAQTPVAIVAVPHHAGR